MADQRLAQVVGQEHVTRTLQNTIRSGRLAHAFLFSGPRGVGKTSVARILAKTINCEDPAHAEEPCGKCASCVSIDASRSMDVIETDAATHTQVEKLRELLEAVAYAPSAGKHRIYIVDEVHMLSKHSFNALLKTLEEPPPNVVFILATTEPHKVPVTIHSRCQHYDFRRIGSGAIAAHIETICRAEGITVSRDAIHRIALAAEGSLRDSQSLLDQVVSFTGTTVTDEDVALVIGGLDRVRLLRILRPSLEGNAGEALRELGAMIDGGADPLRIAEDLVGMLRAMMIIAEVEDPDRILDLPEGELAQLREAAASSDPALMRVRFALLARGEERMRRAPQPRFHLELALVHMAHAAEILPAGQPAPGTPITPSEASRTPPSSGADGPSTHTARVAAPKKPAKVSLENLEAVQLEKQAPQAPAFEDIETPEETWEKLIEFVISKSPGLGNMLSHLVCLKMAGDELVIAGSPDGIYMQIVQEREKKEDLDRLVSEFFSRPVAVRLTPQQAHEPPAGESLVEKREKKESDLARKIRKETSENEAVRSALKVFQGQVESVHVLGEVGADPGEATTREEEQ